MNQVLGPIKLSAGPVAASATRIGARFEAGMIGLGLAGGGVWVSLQAFTGGNARRSTKGARESRKHGRVGLAWFGLA